jgi:FdhE protein
VTGESTGPASAIQASVRPPTPGRLPDTPETKLWRRLVDMVVTELAGPSISSLATFSPPGDAQVPALQQAVIEVDAGRVQGLFTALLRVVSTQDGSSPALGRLTIDRSAARGLVQSAIRQDQEALSGLARIMGADPAALGSIAHLASIPLLASARLSLGERVAADVNSVQAGTQWEKGWCRFCGAWPALSELRGLERSRHLRCGRCAADWVTPWLRCPFCHESDHAKLGELVAEGGAEPRKADTCSSCKGYLKSVPSLSALSLGPLLIADAETLPLDLAALDHGFARPAPAAHLVVQLVERR